VFKIGLFACAETTFVLSGGGHNTAIVSPPGKPRAYFREQPIGSCAPFSDPHDWLAATPKRDGSWWPSWIAWLSERSAGTRVAAPPMGSQRYRAGDDAPGQYVHG
jgi:polyhydroxyalkanoate synthase